MPKHVVVPYVQDTLYSTNKYSCVRRVHTLYIRIVFISVINQLDAQNFCFTISLFHACTCFEHYVLIIRRSKLHYTAPGIVTPIGGRLVHR